jgi:glycosyltransferase involved in cell wall biosynthesis
MKAKITALIPTYKRPELLRRAMLSVLGQSYSNLQLSIFDNASGKDTTNVVTSLARDDHRVKYHCHPKNIGALENFRHAFKSVDTPYFSIISDDDFLAKDFYKNAVDVLDNYPEVMFVILNTLRVDENTNLIGHKVCTNKLSLHTGKKGFDEIHSGNIPLTWTGMVFRKDLAKIYEEMDDENDVGNDMRFIFRAASLYDFAYLSKVGAFFTEHSESASAMIKRVDLVHQGVQISRYTEIFFDKKVPQEVRDRTIFYIKRLLLYKPNLISSIKKIIQNFIIFSEFGNKKIVENIKDHEYAGYKKTSFILHWVHNSTILKIFTRLLFGRLYKNIMTRKQSKAMSLQKGIYKKHFDYVKEDIM